MSHLLRSVFVPVLATCLSAVAVPGQFSDDPDLPVPTFPGHGIHSLRMTQTDDGRLVAAYAVANYGRAPRSQELAVAVSKDGGKRWTLLWDGRSNVYHDNRIADLSVAVEPVRGIGAQADPRIYVALEWHEYDPQTDRPVRRFLEVVDGPLDRTWPGHHLDGVHVHGQFRHQANPGAFVTTSRPSIALPIYAGRHGWRPMVVVAYEWFDDPGKGCYLATPYRGDRGRTVQGRSIFSEFLSKSWAEPSLAADPGGRIFAVAARDRDTGRAVVQVADANLFQSGRYLPYADDALGAGMWRPQVAVENSTVVLTALRETVQGRAFPNLVYFRNRNHVGWSGAEILHAQAASEGVVALREGRMFVTARCRPDNAGSWVVQYGFQVGIHSTFPRVQETVVGDRPYAGRPSLGVVGGSDPCAFGCAETDEIDRVPVSAGAFVDPAR